jgi:sulfur-carrier protein
MIVRVRLFARARDLAGTDALSVEVKPGADVGELRRQLAELRPALASLLERSVLAVNQEFARDDQTLTADSEIALLPPVSGG